MLRISPYVDTSIAVAVLRVMLVFFNRRQITIHNLFLYHWFLIKMNVYYVEYDGDEL